MDHLIRAAKNTLCVYKIVLTSTLDSKEARCLVKVKVFK